MQSHWYEFWHLKFESWLTSTCWFLSLSGSTSRPPSCRPTCHTRRTWWTLAVPVWKTGLQFMATQMIRSWKGFLVVSCVLIIGPKLNFVTWSINHLEVGIELVDIDKHQLHCLLDFNSCCLGLCASSMHGRKGRHPELTWVLLVERGIWNLRCDLIWNWTYRLSRIHDCVTVWRYDWRSSSIHSCLSEPVNWLLAWYVFIMTFEQ